MSPLIQFDPSYIHSQVEAIEPLVKRWAIQSLTECTSLHYVVQDIRYWHLEIAELFEAQKWQVSYIEEEHKSDVLAHLKNQLEQVKIHSSVAVNNRYLINNINMLSKLMLLTESEVKLLIFAIFVNKNTLLEMATNMLGNMADSDLFSMLATLFCEPVEVIVKLFSPSSKLVGSGLITLKHDDMHVEKKLQFISSRFADALLTKNITIDEVIQEFATITDTPALCLGDYAHIQHQISILQPYLEKALGTQKIGVNIFIYGPPGTGKTQLAKVLANTIEIMKVDLYQIASLNGDEEIRTGKERLKALVACQKFIQNNHSMVFIDEVEDIFNDNSLTETSTAKASKAWLTSYLEQNRFPTIWVSNSINGVDPAFLRRFDFILELDVPTEQHRRQIIERTCGNLVSSHTINELASHEELSPAVICNATSVVETISEQNIEERSRALKLIINNTLEAQGHGKLLRSGNNADTCLYNPRYINADYDMQKVVVGLKQHGEGRLCLFGPPGTGKTAFGHYLANQLGKKLHIKKASDIISKYLGDTERNLAKAFEQATIENAVLILDEVDSFLADRKSAIHSWEISAVNEMLTQMELFKGVFIASTNLFNNLDDASIRRFDLKVKFDYLSPKQVREMFDENSDYLSLKQTLNKNKLLYLTATTPGDFTLIARRHKFSALESDSDLFEALMQETKGKCVKQQTNIGFVH